MLIMSQQVEPVKTGGEVAAEVETKAEVYDLHIRLPGESKEKLKDAAELAYRLEQIPKADLVALMNLFITWGLVVLKKQWLDRIGYR